MPGPGGHRRRLGIGPCCPQAPLRCATKTSRVSGVYAADSLCSSSRVDLLWEVLYTPYCLHLAAGAKGI